MRLLGVGKEVVVVVVNMETVVDEVVVVVMVVVVVVVVSTVIVIVVGDSNGGGGGYQAYGKLIVGLGIWCSSLGAWFPLCPRPPTLTFILREVPVFAIRANTPPLLPHSLSLHCSTRSRPRHTNKQLLVE